MPPARIARALRKSGPITPADWKTRYIELIREYGNFYQTARMAGVDPSTALRNRNADPEFDRLCLEARQDFADQLETQMVADSHESGNPAGQIVRLKALRPAEYLEKHLALTLSADLNELPAPDATSILKAMLASATESTIQHLQQQPLAIDAPKHDEIAKSGNKSG